MSRQVDLQSHIVSLSASDDFNKARLEWDLEFITFDELDECPCGHPIMEKCWLHNRKTEQDTFVGNVCVNKFMGINTQTLVTGLKRVKRGGNASSAVINYWTGLGQISLKNRNFLVSIQGKRKLSEKQLIWRDDIFRKVVV